MTAPTVDIRFVDIREKYQLVDAIVTLPNGTKHRVGHLPVTNWFCTCSRAKRCPHIQTLKDLIPGIAPPADPATTPTEPPAPDGVPRE